jgi:hypothetical protein
MFRTLHDAEDAVTIHIDGVPIAAEAGETVAAVLLRQPEAWSRTTSVSGAPRTPYCMMGVLFRLPGSDRRCQLRPNLPDRGE